MSSYLRPRRGKKSTAISRLTSDNPLKQGEIFFEVPDTGVGTGTGNIKIGDGETAYADLPYFLQSNNSTIKTANLQSGSTTVTFNNIPTSGNYLMSLYTDKAGLNYTDVDDSTAGTLTYTFESQSVNVNVYLEIRSID